jgi:methyltransferase-like protein/cyclopropane fatty-acyl-phospholipid synthase-like methyltransferase
MNINNKNSQEKLSDNLTPYDEMPYESYPFPYTRPEYTRTVGKLFGMNPPDIETARILELGSSNGGNLVNFAANYPKSYTIGVDLSKVEIDNGNKKITELGLKNIELKHMSITDIDENFGQFDYIICHGVFSWVPKFVRDKILEVTKKLLTPNGIAFISYNTLPGWNMINTIRDMMMFHSSIFDDTQNKLQQAKLFLNFVNESLDSSASPYAKFLKLEAGNLSKHEDHYLRHEYLAEENVQFYFHDFMDMAKAQGLSYLGDTNIHAMFLGNLPESAAEKLKSINDIVRTEQYMDFIQNKRFRCTLLCHDNITLNRNINAEILNDFYLTCNIIPEKGEKELDLSNAFENIAFYFNGQKDASVSTSSPIMKAIFYSFAENIGNPLKSTQLLSFAHKKLPKLTLDEFKAEFANSIPRLIFSGYIKIFTVKPKAVNTISKKPKVTELCRYQINNCPINKQWITNQVNEIQTIQHYEKFVLEVLNGDNTIDQLEAHLFEKLKSGELVANEGDKRVTDEKALKELAKQCVGSSLERFRTNFILVE